MADQPADLTLVYLRRLDEKLDRVLDDVREMKTRMTSVEERVAKVELSIAGVNRRIDRIEERLDRIERRLDLADAPH